MRFVLALIVTAALTFAGLPAVDGRAGAVEASFSATGFQQDAAHSGSSAMPFAPGGAVRWAKDFTGRVAYPLIVGDRMFVVAGSTVSAVRVSDGGPIWGPVEFGPTACCDVVWGGAYDDGRVYVATPSGVVHAFDGATGRRLWQRNTGLQVWAPLAAYGGQVVVAGSSSSASLVRLRGSDGEHQSATDLEGVTAEGPPALTADRAFVSSACRHSIAVGTYGWGPPAWHYIDECYGGGGTTPSVYRGRLFVRDHRWGHPGDVLSAETGTKLGEFPGDAAVAFYDT